MAASINWQKKARRLVRAEMARKGYSYKALARELAKLGVEGNEKVLSTKVSRGTFSFAFFLQCMHALDVHSISLDEK